MTRVIHGTDVNFGALATKLTHWLGEQEGCGFAVARTASRIFKNATVAGSLKLKIWRASDVSVIGQKFVFIGGGGGTLPLLQKSGIAGSERNWWIFNWWPVVDFRKPGID